MKKQFFDYIIKLMKKNKRIFFISIGLGWPRTEELKQFKDRYIQTEASEQTALDIAVGLAYEGNVPFVYTITPFLYRGFETIRTYINHEKLGVNLVGAGHNDDYSKDDGFSHDATDDKEIFSCFHNITACWPETNEEMADILKEMVKGEKPHYINLRR